MPSEIMGFSAGLWLVVGVILQLSAGGSGQHVRDASSCSGPPVTCDPAASVLLVRTAQYVNQSNAGQCKNAPCPGSDCNMSPEDVLRIYRKCDKNATHCDLSTVGVSSDFRITYYCLEQKLLQDPCHNVKRSNDTISLLVDYARYSRSRDLTCQCVVTSNSSVTTTVRSLHLYENEPGHISGHAPSLTIDHGEWEWLVPRTTMPTQWLLDLTNGRNATFLFRNAYGASSGRTWIDLHGGGLHVTCNYTEEDTGYVPPTVDTSSVPDTPDPLVKSTAQGQQWRRTSDESLLIYVIAGAVSLAAVVVVVVVLVVVARYRHRNARNKQANPKEVSCELNTIARATDSMGRGLEGDYFMIGDFKPPPVGGVCQSRGSPNYDNADGRYLKSLYQEPGSQSVVYGEQNGGPPQAHARGISREDKAKESVSKKGHAQRGAQAPGASPAVPNSRVTQQLHPASGKSEYGSLCHHGTRHKTSPELVRRPSYDRAIYDHAWNFRSADGEDFYNILQRGRQQPVIIDNVYDTASYV